MTDDNDLIRRGDALRLVTDGTATWGSIVDAIRALPAVKPKVRALVWRDRHENSRADVYSARQSYGQGPDAYMLARCSTIVSWHPTMEAAKAAAQADHAAHILAALDLTP